MAAKASWHGNYVIVTLCIATDGLHSKLVDVYTYPALVGREVVNEASIAIAEDRSFRSLVVDDRSD